MLTFVSLYSRQTSSESSFVVSLKEAANKEKLQFQDELLSLKAQVRQLMSERDAEAEARQKALRAHAEELSLKEAECRRDIKAAEDKLRFELDKTRQESVRLRLSACLFRLTWNGAW